MIDEDHEMSEEPFCDPSAPIDFSKPFPNEVITHQGSEYIGAFQVRQDLIISPADPKGLRLGWIIEEEFSGTETYDLSGFFRSGGKIGAVSNVPEGGWHKDWRISRLLDKGVEIKFRLPGVRSGTVIVPVAKNKNLSVGDQVIVSGLTGMDVASIVDVDGDRATADSGGCLWPLQYGADKRGCWVCTCQIAKSVFQDGVASEIKEQR